MMGCPSSTRTRTWPSRSSMMRRQPFRRLNAVKKNCILNYQKRKKRKFLLKILSQFKVLIHRVTTTSRSFPIEIITILFLVTRNYQSNSTTRSIQGRHKVGWRPWVEPFLGAPRFQKNGVVLLLTSRILRYLGNSQFFIVKHTHSQTYLKEAKLKSSYK